MPETHHSITIERFIYSGFLCQQRSMTERTRTTIHNRTTNQCPNESSALFHKFTTSIFRLFRAEIPGIARNIRAPKTHLPSHGYPVSLFSILYPMRHRSFLRPCSGFPSDDRDGYLPSARLQPRLPVQFPTDAA